VSIVTFIMLFLVPGDPAVIIAGLEATPETVARIRQQLNLDKPLWTQYLLYVQGILTGHLGVSIVSYIPVLDLIGPRLRNTLILAITSTIIASIFGVFIGVVSALKRGTLVDTVSMTTAVLGICTPSFFSGLILIYVFTWQLRIFPSLGFTGPMSIVLPAVNLSLWSTANVARLTRTSMIEVLGQDYIRTMRAMGLPPQKVNFKYALRNAFIPVITIIGLQFGYTLAGAVLTETVFTWPGIGTLIVDSILARDFPVIRAGILVIASLFVIVNLGTDLIISIVDPRIRYT
ncbi:MAG: ABC transporter permease, partial [Candidatus Ranarchaeia archaeon]